MIIPRTIRKQDSGNMVLIPGIIWKLILASAERKIQRAMIMGPEVCANSKWKTLKCSSPLSVPSSDLRLELILFKFEYPIDLIDFDDLKAPTLLPYWIIIRSVRIQNNDVEFIHETKRLCFSLCTISRIQNSEWRLKYQQQVSISMKGKFLGNTSNKYSSNLGLTINCLWLTQVTTGREIRR